MLVTKFYQPPENLGARAGTGVIIFFFISNQPFTGSPSHTPTHPRLPRPRPRDRGNSEFVATVRS